MEAYCTKEEAQDILVRHGYENFPGETALINATMYVDHYLSPASSLLDPKQPLLWPRKPFIDAEGRLVEGIPYHLKYAVAVIASEFEEDDLFNNEEVVLSAQSFADTSETYAVPLSTGTKDKVKNVIKRLKRLGYGHDAFSSVRLVRA